MRQAAAPFVPQMRLYREWLGAARGLQFEDFAALRRWSVTDLEGFWRSIWDYHDLRSPTAFDRVLAREAMPGALWFPGARVSYAAQVFRHVAAAEAAGQPAIVAEDETGKVRILGWRELRRQVASVALTLRELGVERGDRVVAYLPNRPETVVALLACASIGAVWSVCPPDMGVPAIRDRFRQVEPRLLIAADGVLYAGRALDRTGVVEALRAELPTLTATILLETPHAARRLPRERSFAEAAARDDAATRDFTPELLPFDHPLWIVYSSGTTGLPKALVHGHGGVMLSTLAGNLHMDLGASYHPNNLGERFHWYSTTGWIMFNAQVNALLAGTTICLFDGAPSGSGAAPDWSTLWRFAARHRVTFVGAGAAFHIGCQRGGLALADCGDLSAVRALGSTGSPLPADTQEWGSAQFAAAGTPDIWWCNISGGTDICGSFLSGNRELPQQPGRMQCRQLGMAVEAWDEDGRALVGAVGELVCVRPIPSMPTRLWNDPDGSRYRAAYFDRFPGVWRHGDWLRIDADESCTISGRSDATINRAGLRMGASEIYAAVERLASVADSLVVDVDAGGGESRLILFVVLAPGTAMDAAIERAIADAIRRSLSPRFVPDDIIAAPAIPRTLSGKKQELPVKRLLQGDDPARVIDPDAMANPACLPWYIALAAAMRSPPPMSQGAAP